MKKSNYVVWPAPSSNFLKMARGPRSLATPDVAFEFSFQVQHSTSKSDQISTPSLLCFFPTLHYHIYLISLKRKKFSE